MGGGGLFRAKGGTHFSPIFSRAASAAAGEKSTVRYPLFALRPWTPEKEKGLRKGVCLAFFLHAEAARLKTVGKRSFLIPRPFKSFSFSP